MARKLKLDPVEMRLRNLIPGEAMPYRGANNLVHDNVNYVPCLELSVAKSEYAAPARRAADAPANGKLRGVGVACFAELTGLGTSTAVGPGTLLQPGRDAATLRLETSGVLTHRRGAAVARPAHHDGDAAGRLRRARHQA